MVVSRYWFRPSCGVSSAILAVALLAFCDGSALAQQPQQQENESKAIRFASDTTKLDAINNDNEVNS